MEPLDQKILGPVSGSALYSILMHLDPNNLEVRARLTVPAKELVPEQSGVSFLRSAISCPPFAFPSFNLLYDLHFKSNP